jgi:hypothetical protein
LSDATPQQNGTHKARNQSVSSHGSPVLLRRAGGPGKFFTANDRMIFFAPSKARFCGLDGKARPFAFAQAHSIGQPASPAEDVPLRFDLDCCLNPSGVMLQRPLIAKSAMNDCMTAPAPSAE